MMGNEGKHHSCHAGWSPAAKSCQADPGHSSQCCSSASWLSLCFFLLFWGTFLMFSNPVSPFLGSLRFGVLEPGPALGHGDVSPHPCPIPVLLNQTLLGTQARGCLGRCWISLMKFSQHLFHIFLFGLISAFAEFHITAKEQKQEIVSIQNLFFF